MVTSTKDFYGLDTTSPGKLDAVVWQDTKIRKYCRDKNKKFNGLIVGLPGTGPVPGVTPGQCDRHYEEYKSYGIPGNRHVFVDCDYRIHNSHEKWKNNNNKSTILMQGYFSQCLDKLWSQKIPISIVDYDGTCNFNEDYEYVIHQSGKYGVEVIILVFTTRKNTMDSFHNDWRKKLGIPRKIWRPERGEHRMPIKEIGLRAVSTLADSYDYDCYTYDYAGRRNGAPPMVSCLLLKR